MSLGKGCDWDGMGLDLGHGQPDVKQELTTRLQATINTRMLETTVS